MPDGANGSYYITIPTNVTFTGLNDTADMTVKLHRTDVTKTIESTLEVKVDVYSENAYKLKATGYTDGQYTLTYTGTNATNDGTALQNADNNGNPFEGAGNASAANGAHLGTLVPDAAQNTIYDANTNPTGNQTSLVGSIPGQAEMTVEPSVDVPGTAFTDKLTYYVTQTRPAVQP